MVEGRVTLMRQGVDCNKESRVLRGLEPTNLGVHIEHLMSLKVLPFIVSVVEQEAILEHKKPANNAQLSLHDTPKSCNKKPENNAQLSLHDRHKSGNMLDQLFRFFYINMSEEYYGR